MATKNLARTIIEGGRTSWSRWYRRHTLREHRAAERAVLRHIEAEGDDDAGFVRRRSAHTAFHDKLGPAKRWLERQVGRPWDRVRSELLKRFDIRTTPGRHIVFCHMLPWVEDDGAAFRRREFEVDRHGLLRKLPRQRHSYARHYEPLPLPRQTLDRWLAGRRVGDRGGTLFWFVPTPAGAYRQDHRLRDEDVAHWRSLPAWFRARYEPGAPSTANEDC